MSQPVPSKSDVGLHPSAHALTVFRILPNGEGRAYTATTFPEGPWQGCEHFLRMCRKVGWLGAVDGSYAVLDVLNENGDIVQDVGIRDASAFQQIKRRLNLRVETNDA